MIHYTQNKELNELINTPNSSSVKENKRNYLDMKTINVEIKTKEERDNLIKQLNEMSFKKTKEERFLELIEGLQVKKDVKKFPNSTFYFKGDECILELENSTLWVKYDRFWNVFKNEYNMEYTETQSFIKDMVEKHFKMKDVTPSFMKSLGNIAVEKHFKMKDVTPSI